MRFDFINEEQAMQIVGGNAGIIGFNLLSEELNSRIAAIDTPVKAAALATAVKAFGGMACLAAAGKVGYGKGSDALKGAGLGPMMTIAQDWYTAYKVGTIPTPRRARPRSFARPFVGPTGTGGNAGNQGLRVTVG